jgi:tetratricopeptide (TPR) repeat protein
MRAADSDRTQQSLLLQAKNLHRLGRTAEAIPLYEKHIQAAPRDADAHNMLGIAYFQSGRPEQAADMMGKALALNPSITNGDFNLANILQAAGRNEEACRHYERALRRTPSDVQSLQNLAILLSRLGRYGEAAERFRQALALTPKSAELYLGLGVALVATGRIPEAVECYTKALAIRPDYYEALINLGNAAIADNRHERALDHYKNAIALRPGQAISYLQLAEALRGLRRREEAADACKKALSLEPDNVDILTILGNELRALDQYEEAAAHHERAVALMPENADLQRNLGITLATLGQTERAIECYDKALTIRPHPEAATAKAHSYLEDGRFVEGWPLLERRRELKSSYFVERNYSAPRWNGARLEGTLLVWGEEGLGDQVLHASIIPEARKLVGSLVLELDPRLVKLFTRSFPTVDVIPMKPELFGGEIQAHCPIGGLGVHLRRSWADFPRRERGYLRADVELAHKLRTRLATDGRKLIGLSWRSLHPEWGKNKTARLSDFEMIMRWPNVRFVDLQYGETRDERAALGQTGIEFAHLDDIDNTNDIDALAALITACDVVITVSNTTAHLAGALGKPVWLLVPFGQGRFWYWFKDRKDSPWYPHMCIYRQLRGQSWADLVSSIEKDLSEFIERLSGAN